MLYLLINLVIVSIWLFIIRKKDINNTITLQRFLCTLGLTLVTGMIYTLTGIIFMSGFSTNISWGTVALVPFRGIGNMIKAFGFSSYVIMNLCGNVAMFIPIGFLLPLLTKQMRKLWKVVLMGAGVSVLIEFIQLFIIRGTDIDDVILNTTGAFIGYLLFCLAKLIFPTAIGKFIGKEPQSTVWRITPCLIVLLSLVNAVINGFIFLLRYRLR